MKPVLRILVGVLAMLIGMLGIALSVFIIIQTRQTSQRMQREIPQSLEHVEQIAQSVRQQGETTQKVLETTRDRVNFLGETIESLSTRLSQRDAKASLLTSIDDDIDKQLDNAKQFVFSMQNSMRNMGSTLMLFDSMSIFGPQRFAGAAENATLNAENPLRAVATGLTQTADLLDQVTDAISKLQNGETITPPQLVVIQQTLRQVDGELVKIKSEVKHFSEEVGQTEDKITKVKEDSPRWIRSSANVIMLFMFCFGCSQLMLSGYGIGLIWRTRIIGDSQMAKVE